MILITDGEYSDYAWVMATDSAEEDVRLALGEYRAKQDAHTVAMRSVHQDTDRRHPITPGRMSHTAWDARSATFKALIAALPDDRQAPPALKDFLIEKGIRCIDVTEIHL